MFCGDLFTHLGPTPALTSDDVVGLAMEAEDLFHASSLTPATEDVLRGLGDLAPSTLAIMHGSSFQGDGKQAFHALADRYAELLSA